MWYTQWKDNGPIELGPIELEDFKEVFLWKYRREVKIEEFINLRQGNMSVEEYYLKFTLLSRYDQSLLSRPREEMSRFVTAVDDLVKEEFHMTMLHNDMNLTRLMVYAQSIEESKLSRISRNLKRRISDEQNQPRFKKRAPNHDGLSAPKVKVEGGSNSQGVKTTCTTCGKKHWEVSTWYQ